MTILFGVLMTISIVSLVLSTVQLRRIERLSNALQKIIEDVYQKRMAAVKKNKTLDDIVRDYKYPDIESTYDNLKWYKPWEPISNLIAYEKDL